MADAKTMVQEWLDRLTEVYSREDFEAYADMLVFPHVVVTRAAVLIVEDEARLKEGFDAWVSMLKTQNVSDVIHTVQDANEIDAELISASYVTHLLRGATPICPPYSSTVTFRCDAGRTLRLVSMTNGMKNLSWPITVPRVEGDGDPLEWVNDGPKEKS